MIEIDKNTHRAHDNGYYKSKTSKYQIVVDLSLRSSNNHNLHLKNLMFLNKKNHNTYTISRDGIIYEHFDSNYYSDYINHKKTDMRIISIVLENMGSLSVKDDIYFNWINEKCDGEYVLDKKWLNKRYWEVIRDEQLSSLCDLVESLIEKHSLIRKEVISFHYYNENINKFNGVVFKSNYVDQNSANHPQLTPLVLKELLFSKK